jgi:hypothetical protein
MSSACRHHPQHHPPAFSAQRHRTPAHTPRPRLTPDPDRQQHQQRCRQATQQAMPGPTTAAAACVVLVHSLCGQQQQEDKQQLTALLGAARASGACQRVYVAQLDAATPAPGGGVTQQVLEALARLYGAVGAADARWDVVPCLRCAGWDAGAPGCGCVRVCVCVVCVCGCVCVAVCVCVRVRANDAPHVPVCTTSCAATLPPPPRLTPLRLPQQSAWRPWQTCSWCLRPRARARQHSSCSRR